MGLKRTRLVIALIVLAICIYVLISAEDKVEALEACAIPIAIVGGLYQISEGRWPSQLHFLDRLTGRDSMGANGSPPHYTALEADPDEGRG